MARELDVGLARLRPVVWLGVAAGSGILMAGFLILPPNPHAAAPLYFLPASAIAAVPAGFLLLLVRTQKRLGGTVGLALTMAATSLGVLALRMFTEDYDTGSYQRDLGRLELLQGLIGAGILAAIGSPIAALLVCRRAQTGDLGATGRTGAAILAITVLGIAGATVMWYLLDADLVYDDQSGLLVTIMFGFVIVIALAASFSPIGLLAAPLAAWPAWMTVLLLHQRAFWENDVSQGDIARSCVRYAIVNALAAGMVVGVTIVRRQQPNERSRTTARPPAAHRSK